MIKRKLSFHASTKPKDGPTAQSSQGLIQRKLSFSRSGKGPESNPQRLKSSLRNLSFARQRKKEFKNGRRASGRSSPPTKVPANMWQRRLLPHLTDIRQRASTLGVSFTFLLSATVQGESGKAIRNMCDEIENRTVAIRILLSELCDEEMTWVPVTYEMPMTPKRSAFGSKQSMFGSPAASSSPTTITVTPSATPHVLAESPKPRMGESVDRARKIAASAGSRTSSMIDSLKDEVMTRTVTICTLLIEVNQLDQELHIKGLQDRRRRRAERLSKERAEAAMRESSIRAAAVGRRDPHALEWRQRPSSAALGLTPPKPKKQRSRRFRWFASLYRRDSRARIGDSQFEEVEVVERLGGWV